jgi:hypothetical protein
MKWAIGIAGALWVLCLTVWTFYLLNYWYYLIVPFDNPNVSHVPGYLIVAGFFSFPILVAASLILAWIFRNYSKKSISLALLFLPLVSIAAFFGGSESITAREQVQFSQELKRIEITPRDFVCPDGHYIQINDKYVVSYITKTDTSFDEMWAGNIDPQTNVFQFSVPWNGWEADLKDCKNQTGEFFLNKYTAQE